MAKGINHRNSGNFKRTHYNFKKRCCNLACKKRARYIINDKPYCRIHWKEA